MPIAIRPVTYSFSLPKTDVKKNHSTNPIYKNEISFGSLEAASAIEAQALSGVRKNLISTDKTRLGANFNKETNTIDFKLASVNAQRVFLSIFDEPKGKEAILNIPMAKQEGSNIWETSVPLDKLNDGKEPVYYGYRVFGPNWQYSENFFDEEGKINDPSSGFCSLVDENGNRYNPNKLAFDPYTRELSHLPSDNPQGEEAFFTNENNYLEDNAKYAPKSVFVINKDTVIPKAKSRALSDEIIGEVHIKDLSINEDVDGAGTYLGAKNMAAKLKNMGFTMIEFLPLTEFDDKEGGGNYWGYMPLGYFAPAKKYSNDKSAGGALKEFREMVKAFHKEDLKVCMDIVFNHTGEAGLKNNDINNAKQSGFSLIDNQMYYKQKAGKYNSNSGCGNDMNVAQDEVMQFVADSVAYWAHQGVDAFRFDLAAGLMDIDPTDKVYYDANRSLVGKMSTLLKERGIKVLEPNQKGDGIYLIAEPWTCGGDNSYQLGRFPKEWAQWNDIARESIKRDSTFPFTLTPRALRNVLEGSYDVLGGGDKSINYAYSHDGFNLNDGNSYQSPPDCWHFATNYSGNTQRQESAMKKQIALTLLSKGTPMLQVGDIIAHSKGGDDNSYNKDNDTNYLDFSKIRNLDTRKGRIYDFSRKMIEFRKEHPELRYGVFNKDIQYFKPDGSYAQNWDNSYWDNVNSNIMCFKISDGSDIFISTSSDEHYIDVKLPNPKQGKTWHLVCDTSREKSFVEHEEKIPSNNYIQAPHSLLIFEER